MASVEGTSFYGLVVLTVCYYSTALPVIPQHYSCNKTSFLSGKLEIRHTDPITFASTVTELSLLKGETICYDLVVEEDGNTTSRSAFITLVNVRQEYKVKSAYNFSVPNMEVKCECDCRGGGESKSCSRDKETTPCTLGYSSGSGECANKYSSGHQRIGCLNPSAKEAEICCEISVYKKNSLPDFTAVFFHEPVTVYTFETGFLDEGQNLIGDSKQTELADNVREMKTNIGVVGVPRQNIEKSVLEPKGYFIEYSKAVLLSGEPVNELHESHLNKLGWYKFDNDGKLLPLDWSKMRQSITNDINDCGANNLTWKSNASFYTTNETDQSSVGRAVQHVLHTALNAYHTAKSVTVSVDTPLPVPLRATINASAKLVFHYEKFSLDKFTAEIQIDNFGKSTLFLQLFAASGFFNGSIEVINSSDDFFAVLIPSLKPIDAQRMISLSSNHKCPSKICLRTEEFQVSHCVIAFCKQFQNGNDTQTLPFFSDLTITLICVGGAACIVLAAILIFCCLRKKGCSRKRANPRVSKRVLTQVSSLDYDDNNSTLSGFSLDSQPAGDHIYSDLDYTLTNEDLLAKDRSASSRTHPPATIRETKKQQGDEASGIL